MDHRTLLRRFRDRRRWSQERLGLEADIDHSLVSRVESGRRQPTRSFVLAVAGALDLTDEETDALLLASGFAALYPENALLGEPQLRALWRILRDGTRPEGQKARLRSALGLLAGLAEELPRYAELAAD